MFFSGPKSTPTAARAFALINLFLFTAAAHAQGIPLSQDACKRLSDGAKLTGTKALIIGYEGLFSSSPLNANLLAGYRDKLAHGEKAHRPLFLFGGSFLVRGPLVRIVERYKNKVEVLVFGRTGMTHANSLPAKCAEIWMSEKSEGRKVIIVGHSFGGGAAWELADALRSKGVPVDGVITADPRSPKMCGGECWNWAKPSNVKIWDNCYQSVPLRGHPVPGARNHFQGAIGHVAVQNTPCVYQGIANRIDGVNAPLTTDKLKYVGDGKATGKGGSLPGGSSITGGGSDAAKAAPARPASQISNPGFASSAFGNAYAPGGRAGPGTQAEKNWMDRATMGSAGGASALAEKISPAGPGVVHYSKPGGEDLKPKSTIRAANATGSSRPAEAHASGGSAGGGGEGAALAPPSRAKPAAAASADATGALSSLWPTGGSAPAGGGTAPASATGGSPIAMLNEAAGGTHNAATGSSDDAFTGESAAGTAAPQAAPAEPAGDVSLFERIHSKLLHLRPMAKAN